MSKVLYDAAIMNDNRNIDSPIGEFKLRSIKNTTRIQGTINVMYAFHG